MSKARVALPGSQKTAADGAEVMGAADPAETTHVTVYVRHKKEPEALKPDHIPMTHEAFVAAHGADPADFDAVKEFAKEYNLTPENENLGARSIELHGTVANLSRAFGTTLDKVKIGAHTYRHRTGELTVPENLAALNIRVFGLDNRPAAQPHIRSANGGGQIVAHAASNALTAVAVAQLYGFPAKLDGTGQTIAIIELGGGFTQADLNTYFKGLKLTTPSVTAVSVGTGKNAPGGDADDEVLLDIEVAGAVAPGAKQRVYFAPNTDQGFIDAVSQAIHDASSPAAVSISWGSAESNWTSQSMQAMEQAFQDAATLGIPVCVASGDNGSSDGEKSLEVDFPASAPHALGCGGTTLMGSGATISSEKVWNDGTQGGGTGGGVSQVFAKPAYQSTVTVPAPPKGKTGGRGVPDVSGDADPNTGYKVVINGKNVVVGGTSAVAPLWSGLIALFAQSLGRKTGFLNTVIYQTAVSSVGFHDITAGTNDNTGKFGKYTAGKGWDACTGLGSPKGAALLQAIAAIKPPQTIS